jgi:drug/metabolite transporter (DMT)-like permease
VPLVILVSQGVGLVLAAALVVGVREDTPSASRFLYGLLAGTAGLAGLSAFYTGMKVGAMGVVAPISSTAALVPVSVGLARGERPSGLQAIGIALALVGVIAASIEPERALPRDRRIAAGAGSGILAAAAFGAAVVGLNAAAKGGSLWAAFTPRLATVPLALVLVVATRAAVGGTRRNWLLLVVVGLTDTVGIVLFGLAGNRGLLSLVSVLAALYPVIIVVLARALLAERLARTQLAGAAIAVVGVALISAG